MMDAINELANIIINGNQRADNLKELVANNLKEVVRFQEFYKLGLDVLCEILDKSDNIDSSTIATIMKFGYEQFGSKASFLLPHIKCGKINSEKGIESILSSIEFIPIIREIRRSNQEMMDKIGEEMKENEKDLGREREIEDEGEGIDVDWECEYNKIKSMYEMMGKNIYIMRQLLRTDLMDRNIEGETRERVEKIIGDKDVNRMMEIISEDPNLIHGDILHMCSKSGWMEGIDLILDICNLLEDYVDKKDKDGWTSLMTASASGQLKIVDHLILKGANIEAKNNIGSTSLIIASDNGHLEVVKYLISKGANIDENKNNGHLEVAQLLIERGANIEAKDKDGLTSLISASYNGHLEVVKYLISKGANIEVKSKLGWTALIFAASNGHLEVVKYLISNGANIEAKNKSGMTALIDASNNGHLEVVKYLISNGANIDAKNKSGWTALMAASNKGHLETVEYLISMGANTEVKSKFRGTTSMYKNICKISCKLQNVK